MSEKPLVDDVIDCNEMKRLITSLSRKTCFSKVSFRLLLFNVLNNMDTIPLQILHWLEECNIMYFEEYW